MAVQQNATTICNNACDSDPSVNLSKRFKKTGIQKGRCAMASAHVASARAASADIARAEFGDLPRGNPCAQCGRPISIPEWIEAGQRRTSYLWHCFACDYRFEAVAFEGALPEQEPLAA
jgi:hypothetical protein